MRGAESPAMSSLWLDVRYALRMLAKAPGLTAVLLITLALGIGASTTIFSVVNSVVLRPLPYDHPEQLVRAYTEMKGKVLHEANGVTVPGFRDLSRSCRTCARLGAWYAGSTSLSNGERAVRVQATYPTHDLLPLLGVRPILGRWFDEAEDQPGAPRAIVIGYELWQRVFAGDRAIVGKQVRLNAAPVTVVGVMPPGFSFPEHEEVWIPAGLDFAAKDNEASFASR